MLRATAALIVKQTQDLVQKQNRLLAAEQAYAYITNKTNQKKLEQSRLMYQKTESSLQVYEQQFIIDNKLQRDAKRDLKRLYICVRLFGLTAKERKQQYKKQLSVQSSGFKNITC